MEKLRNSILTVEIALNDAKTNHIEAEIVLNEATNLFRNIPKVWQIADVASKKKIQHHIFPEGLVYSETGISNRSLSTSVAAIKEFSANHNRMGSLKDVDLKLISNDMTQLIEIITVAGRCSTL